MADICLGNLNFIQERLILVIMIIATFAASIYAIHLSRRMKTKEKEDKEKDQPRGVR